MFVISEFLILRLQGASGLPEFIQVHRHGTIRYINDILQQLCPVNNDTYQFYDCYEHSLDYDHVIGEVGLVDWSTLIVIQEQHFSGELSVDSLLRNQETLTMRYVLENTVGELKQAISSKIHENIDNFVLFIGDTCLEEKKMLLQYYKFPLEISYVLLLSLKNLSNRQLVDEGRFAKIFTYEVNGNNETIALKRYKLNEFGRVENFPVLVREIVHCAVLETHERIVKIQNLYRDSDYLYFSMEYMCQKSLRHHMDSNEKKPLIESRIKHFSRQILEGLAFLHRKKIIHCDIKCASILMGSGDTVKISGFGLSKYVNDRAHSALLSGIQQSRPNLASFNWTAPEIIDQDENADTKFGSKVDIWSFGASLVEMVTGLPPYHKLQPHEVIMVIGRQKTIDYVTIEPLSDQLADVIRVCLLSANDRPGAADLLRHDFLSIV